MTREEAAKNPVDLAIWEFENAIKGTEEENSEYPNYCIHIDEYKTALKALLWMKGPQPDPDTGLVPCGWCVPERIGWFRWNRAMGWRASE